MRDAAERQLDRRPGYTIRMTVVVYCDRCGGDIHVRRLVGSATCQDCGRTITIPWEEDE